MGLEVGGIVREVSGMRLGDLPEGCLAMILSMTSPRDVARLACTSRDFRDAAGSDSVWQALLPRRYSDTLKQAVYPLASTCTKKEIYDQLSNHVLLNNGSQDFWLDKATGGVCRSVSARSMYICWGDDRRYWEWLEDKCSRFSEVAYLKSVCWLEVRGELDCFLPPGRYSLSWKLFWIREESGTRPRHTSSDIMPLIRRYRGWNSPLLRRNYGWNSHPLKFTLEVASSESPVEFTTREEYVTKGGSRPIDEKLALDCRLGRIVRTEELDGGEFLVNEWGMVRLKFSMCEIEGGAWKTGMYLDGVVIRPFGVEPERPFRVKPESNVRVA